LDSRELEKPFFECVFATYDNLTSEEMSQSGHDLLSTARHPLTVRHYSGMVYQPMLDPPEQVVGSNPKMQFENSAIILTPEMDFFNNGPGKPIGIYKNIGRRPILAIGNPDRDLEMLQGTTSAAGPRFGAIIHHDDARRDTAYD